MEGALAGLMCEQWTAKFTLNSVLDIPFHCGERDGLVVNASDAGSRVRGSSPTRVKPCCLLEQGTFTPQKYW